ncbi:phage minor head protein [Rhodoblastus sp.]|uniref:phage minor head protein n=1 Tax=Rhodoblastus sp. TaxID=1962975 RepID=UPI003F9A3E45
MQLVAPKATALPPVPPNAGLAAWYFDQLRRLLDAMAASMELHIRASWRRDPPAIGMAKDASPSIALKRTMGKWGREWVSKFDAMSAEIARKFANRAHRHVNKSNAAILKKAGFTVAFSPTAAAKEAYQATVAQNVALIRRLPRDYYANIQNDVWASVMAGQDMGALAKTLRTTYHMSLRRAALVSRDQNRKATALIENVRRSELGITHALWLHSHAVRYPRPSHQAFSGHVYELKKGAYLDGKWVWPGTEINCQCLSRAIIPGVNDAQVRRVVERERAGA